MWSIADYGRRGDPISIRDRCPSRPASGIDPSSSTVASTGSATTVRRGRCAEDRQPCVLTAAGPEPVDALGRVQRVIGSGRARRLVLVDHDGRARRPALGHALLALGVGVTGPSGVVDRGRVRRPTPSTDSAPPGPPPFPVVVTGAFGASWPPISSNSRRGIVVRWDLLTSSCRRYRHQRQRSSDDGRDGDLAHNGPPYRPAPPPPLRTVIRSSPAVT